MANSATGNWSVNSSTGDKSAKMAQVDGKVIKADTFYTLKHGGFVEVD